MKGLMFTFLLNWFSVLVLRVQSWLCSLSQMMDTVTSKSSHCQSGKQFTIYSYLPLVP